jgi:hypothetical protein
MKNRKERRILRRTTREYQKILGDNKTPQLPFNLPTPNYPGEMFQKFSLYDENRRTYTDISTEYFG